MKWKTALDFVFPFQANFHVQVFVFLNMRLEDCFRFYGIVLYSTPIFKTRAILSLCLWAWSYSCLRLDFVSVFSAYGQRLWDGCWAPYCPIVHICILLTARWAHIHFILWVGFWEGSNRWISAYIESIVHLARIGNSCTSHGSASVMLRLNLFPFPSVGRFWDGHIPNSFRGSICRRAPHL